MRTALLLCLLSPLLMACTHRVELVPPNEPITINMNIKVEHELRIEQWERHPS